MRWKCYNIEPTSYSFDKLAVNRPLSHNFKLALSDKEEDVEMSLMGDGSGINTFSDYGELTSKNFGVAIQKTEKVHAVTYKQFIEQNNIKFLDLFVLDVEEHEPAVLEGMKGCSVLPAILCIEINFSKNFDSIRKTCEELGYVFDLQSFVNYLFIRKDLLPLFTFRVAMGRGRIGRKNKELEKQKDWFSSI
jgi:FkbM family methyltransferase